MTYYLVYEGAIHETFDDPDVAAQRARERGEGWKVVGDEWLAVGTARHNVEQAQAMLDELAPLLDPASVWRKRAQLIALDDALDARLGVLGLT